MKLPCPSGSSTEPLKRYTLTSHSPGETIAAGDRVTWVDNGIPGITDTVDVHIYDENNVRFDQGNSVDTGEYILTDVPPGPIQLCLVEILRDELGAVISIGDDQCCTDMIGTAVVVNPNAIYVTTVGNDNNDGSSEAQALATIQAGINRAQPGDTVYVKKGTYNDDGVRTVRAGTFASPIIIEGYNNVPGDRPCPAFSESSARRGEPDLMPVLVASDPNSNTTTIGMDMAHSYTELYSFASVFHTIGFYTRPDTLRGKAAHIYCYSNGDADYSPFYRGSGFCIRGTEWDMHDMYGMNGTGAGHDIGGLRNVLRDIAYYNNEITETAQTSNHWGTDYFFSVGGADNELYNVIGDQSDTLNVGGHIGHGMHMIGDRNKVFGLRLVNMGDGLLFNSRNGDEAIECEVYDVELLSRAPTGTSNVGIYWFGGRCTRNLVKRGIIEQLPGAVFMYGVRWQERPSDGDGIAGGLDNRVEDVLIKNCSAPLSFRFGGTTRRQVLDNVTIEGGSQLFQVEHTVEQSVRLINSTVTGVSTLKSGSGALQMTQAASSFTGTTSSVALP